METAMQVSRTEETRQVEKKMQIAFKAEFDANQLCRHVARVRHCKRVLAQSFSAAVVKGGFAEKALRREN